jgi:hypothetical protein
MTQAVALAQQASTGVSPGFRNRIINGGMTIDQRNAGASVVATDGGYTLDRWKGNSSQVSKFTVQQDAGSVTPPAGFTDYLGVTSSAATSVGSNDYYIIRQAIEGFNIADLGFGTANAKTVTLSFWVRSSLTGTFSGTLNNSGSSRSYPYTYTISSANTWEYKTITIAGDTSGTWLATNGIGLWVSFSLGMGSTYSAAAGAWIDTEEYAVTGSVSVVGTNGATWYITGVQLEVGSTATSFEYLDYGRSLIQCQRYFQTIGAAVGSGNFYDSTQILGGVAFPVQMRASPTLSATGGLVFSDTAANFTQSSAVFTDSQISKEGMFFRINNLTPATTAYRFYTFSSTNSSNRLMLLSAEL